MILVVIASALGVITITGAGLFLRRLFGEIAELRRQITRFDRQMRAQRARETFLRQLLTQDQGDEDDGDPPAEAAVVNGHEPELPPGLMAEHQQLPHPARQKKHLGLYIGGAVAAMTIIGREALDVVHAHRARFISAATGAAVTAATVTVITVQPWTGSFAHRPPSFAPSAGSSPAYTPPSGPHPPRPALGDTPSHSHSGTPTAPAPQGSSGAGTNSPTGGIVPAAHGHRAGHPTSPGRGGHRRDLRSTPPGQPQGSGQSAAHKPSTGPAGGAPGGGHPGGSNSGGHDQGPSVTVTIPPLLDIGASLICV